MKSVKPDAGEQLLLKRASGGNLWKNCTMRLAILRIFFVTRDAGRMENGDCVQAHAVRGWSCMSAVPVETTGIGWKPSGSLSGCAKPSGTLHVRSTETLAH